MLVTGSAVGGEIGIAGWPGREAQVDVAACRGSYMVAWSGGSDLYRSWREP